MTFKAVKYMVDILNPLSTQSDVVLRSGGDPFYLDELELYGSAHLLPCPT